jgi:hypothetical protein
MYYLKQINLKLNLVYRVIFECCSGGVKISQTNQDSETFLEMY